MSNLKGIFFSRKATWLLTLE